jgi:hypothetical protein
MRQCSPFEPEHPGGVADDMGQTDLGCGPGDADGADEKPEPMLPRGEYSLDRRARLRARGIGFRLWRG